MSFVSGPPANGVDNGVSAVGIEPAECPDIVKCSYTNEGTEEEL